MSIIYAEARRGLWSGCAPGGAAWLGWLCLTWLSASTLYGQTSATAAEVACELRIVWGGETPRSYTGSLSVDSGTIKVVRNLSLQSDSIGSIVNENLQTLEIKPQSATSFGGVDVAVKGSTSTQLRLRFNDPGNPTPAEFQVQLGDLLHGNWVQSLDPRGNRIAIERQMHDRLRVQLAEPDGILQANQPLSLELSGYRTGLSAGSATAELRFVHQTLGAGPVVQQTLAVDSSGSFEKSEIELQTPATEGAYHLEISVVRLMSCRDPYPA